MVTTESKWNSGWYLDFVAAALRSQIASLQTMINNIEGLSKMNEGGYIDASLKRVEKDLRRLRKYLNN